MTGGRALEVLSRCVWMRRVEALWAGEVVGNHTREDCEEHACSPSARSSSCVRQGISKEGYSRSGGDAGIINKLAWYAYNGVKIGQGRENAKNYQRIRLDL